MSFLALLVALIMQLLEGYIIIHEVKATFYLYFPPGAMEHTTPRWRKIRSVNKDEKWHCDRISS